jgi:hypothetical protein
MQSGKFVELRDFAGIAKKKKKRKGRFSLGKL